MKKIIIAAISKNGVIGRSNGEMAWHVKEEFQHFKNTTMGFPIIMGRKTFESLKKPLKGRLNIILSRNNKLNYPYKEILIFGDLKEVYAFCESNKHEKIFIIGGGEVFSEAMNTADEMLISIMDFEAEGDVFFPEIGSNLWIVESKEKKNLFEILKYVRK